MHGTVSRNGIFLLGSYGHSFFFGMALVDGLGFGVCYPCPIFTTCYILHKLCHLNFATKIMLLKFYCFSASYDWDQACLSLGSNRCYGWSESLATLKIYNFFQNIMNSLGNCYFRICSKFSPMLNTSQKI